jgi:hypothetical protein
MIPVSESAAHEIGGPATEREEVNTLYATLRDDGDPPAPGRPLPVCAC